MNSLFLLLEAEAEPEMVNVTPVLLRFAGKFFLIFAAVAIIAVLTPWLAKKVDEFRENHRKEEPPEDPRCKAVRGPYDMPEPKKPEPDAEPDEDTPHNDETP